MYLTNNHRMHQDTAHPLTFWRANDKHHPPCATSLSQILHHEGQPHPVPEVEAAREMVHRGLPWTASSTMPWPAPVGPVRRRERKQQETEVGVINDAGDGQSDVS